MRIRLAWLLSVVLAAGLVPWSAGAVAAAAACPPYRDLRAGSRVPIARIHEISGLDWSPRRHVLWFNEDSGNPARLYAITRGGRPRTSMTVTNATNHDWEDMALAAHRLWIGDIGDNGSKRAEVQVYVVPEPRLAARSVRAKILHLRYPDGAHNAEALVVDARVMRLFIITKERDRDFADVYGANVRSFGNGTTRRMARIGRIPIGNVTAADLGPEGLVVKNYRHGLLYRWQPDHRLATAIRGRPCDVTVGGGETITFSPGHRLYAIPEGRRPIIYRTLWP